MKRSFEGTGVSTRFHASPNVRLAVTEKSGILLNIQTGKYYGLSSQGVRVWLALAQGIDLGQVSEDISREHCLSRERIHSDLTAFLGKLCAYKLCRYVL
jgi:hypothetical protein